MRHPDIAAAHRVVLHGIRYRELHRIDRVLDPRDWKSPRQRCDLIGRHAGIAENGSRTGVEPRHVEGFLGRQAEVDQERRELDQGRHDLAAARRSLGHDKQVIAAIGTAAAPLSGDVDRITNELQSLTSYLTSTPPGALDAGYVQAQLAYLTKTVTSFKAAVAAVQSRAH